MIEKAKGLGGPPASIRPSRIAIYNSHPTPAGSCRRLSLSAATFQTSALGESTNVATTPSIVVCRP